MVGWLGSVVDGRVFANSYLKKNLEQLLGNLHSTPVPTRLSSTSHDTRYEDVPAFILGDSAYPSRTRVVPTFRNCECNRSRHVKELNAKLAGIRYSVENVFGILKVRFRLLNRPLECAKEHIVRTSYLITAIFVVHNFLIDGGDEFEATCAELEAIGHPVDLNHDGDGAEDLPRAEGSDDGGPPTRDVLLRHMYWKNSR
jgi:DDE superfamily endonuclease